MYYRVSRKEKIKNNSIAMCRPAIAKRWDYSHHYGGLFETTPEDVSYDSKGEYYFQCEEGHKFVSKIDKDIPYVLCPECEESYVYIENKFISLRQATLYFYLKKVFPDAKMNHNEGNHLWDIYIPSLNLLIEYDSKEFHSDEARILKDKEHDVWAKIVGRQLARIDAQYDGDFDNINKIAKKIHPGKYDLPDNTCRLLEDVYMTCDYLKYKFGITGTLDIDWQRDKSLIKELTNECGYLVPYYDGNIDFLKKVLSYKFIR